MVSLYYLTGKRIAWNYTDMYGFVHFEVPAGNYNVTASCDSENWATYQANAEAPGSLVLSLVGAPSVTASVYQRDGSPLSTNIFAAPEEIPGAALYLGFTGADGILIFQVPAGNYHFYAVRNFPHEMHGLVQVALVE